MYNFAVAVYSFALAIILSVFAGVVFISGWDWFIRPLNEVIPALTLAHAVGIMCLSGFLRTGTTVMLVEIRKDIGAESDDTFTSVLTKKIAMALLILIIWGIMAFWHSLM